MQPIENEREPVQQIVVASQPPAINSQITQELGPSAGVRGTTGKKRARKQLEPKKR